MIILSVNAGSSSLKFSLFEMPEGVELVNGYFEKIGLSDSFYSIKVNGEKIIRDKRVDTHKKAVEYLCEELIENGIINSMDEIKGIGHRIVNGGPKYKESILIDDDFIKEFENLIEYAPLHNPAHLVGIKAFKETLPNVKNVCVFDTAFHQTMDEVNYLYPVPYEWYTKYGIRKYGAHGTSHRFVYKTICEKLQRDDLKVISCHIGSGASLCAIDGGKVLDTSMGFTPLAGIMMGTRCGDVDASIIPYIMKKENLTIDEVINVFNKKSGLLGVSGVSSDSRDIENGIKEGNERCILAQDMYVQKIANYIAMYNNLLNNADVIVFTAGVGENSVQTRQMIVDKIHSLGVSLDKELNNCRGVLRKISNEDSRIPVYIVPTNEELMIAKDTYELIG
ncbi:MAG: acetate kinase [Tenericutes bacterium]|nr:acetate kinase [Mycoplasmatota bacterium]